MTRDQARQWFDRFRKTSMSLAVFTARHKVSEQAFRDTMRRFFAEEWTALMELRQPRTTPYERGAAFEYRVRSVLLARGWWVFRSHASRSPADLLALKMAPRQLLAVQAKKDGAISPAERQALRAFAVEFGATPVVARSEGGRLKMEEVHAETSGEEGEDGQLRADSTR